MFMSIKGTQEFSRLGFRIMLEKLQRVVANIQK